jgi:putative PIN family toxin of toxin-antitoxin system
MKIKKIPVIIDTNLWISVLISKNYIQLDKLIASNKIQLLFSKELIEEFITVTNRPKFKKYFSDTVIERLLLAFDSIGRLVVVKSNVKVCRDFKDNFLLNLAIDGKASYLVSGDNDLLTLKKIGETKIVSMAEFLNEI